MLNRNWRRLISIITILALLLSVMTGCKTTIKSMIGEDIKKGDEIDFAASWIKDKKSFNKDEDDWKIGFMGKSVKITSGAGADSGAWYIGPELADTWGFNTQISFSGIKKKDSSAYISFVTAGKDNVLTLKMNRKATGEVQIEMTSGNSQDTAISKTDFFKTEDTIFDVTILNIRNDRRLQIDVTGDTGFGYHVLTEAVDEESLQSIATFGYKASLIGVNFHMIALNNAPGSEGIVQNIAQTALNDLYTNFWRGDAATGQIMKEDHGYENEGRQTMIWAHAMMLFGMEAMYLVTGDEDIKTRITAHWNFTKDNFSEEELTAPGRSPNIAVDDAGWDAMAYMLFYRMTGDPYALKIAKGVIENSYDYWKDETVENGLWYMRNDTNPLQDKKWKSLYTTGLMLAALELYEVAQEEKIYRETLALYEWIEEYLLRDKVKQYDDLVIDATDNLYWCDFNVNRETHNEVTGPDGGSRPDDITEAGSVSFLGGNMAMAVIHAKLYKITGEAKYKQRALETVRAINDGPYDNNGVYLNDRDAWTTGAFAKWWAQEVLTLDGITEKDIELMKSTALSIGTAARTSDGYYGGSWSGPADGFGSKWFSAGSKPQQIMTSANSCNMIFAAALIEKLTSEDTEQ